MAARGKYSGQHAFYMTAAEGDLGYPKAKKCLMGYSDDALAKLFHEATRDSLVLLFGHNARKTLRLVTAELHARGIYELPSIFGPIKVEC